MRTTRLRFAGGDLVVLLPDTAEEGVLLLLEAVFVWCRSWASRRVVAAAGALQAAFERGQQQEGEVGLHVAADEPVEIEHHLGAELAAAALIGLSGVGEAVAEHDLARVESRLDDLGDGLGAVGEHEGHLGHGRDGVRAGVEQQFADAVAGCGAAGLAGEHGFMAALRASMPPSA